MSNRSIGLTLIAALMLSLCTATTPSVRAQTDEEVQESIDRVKRFFYRKFDGEAGNWEKLYTHANGGEGAITSMVVLSLMLSGESAQKPEIAQAIAWLKTIRNEMTYGVSLRCHVWGQLSDTYLPNLRKDAHWLEKWGAGPDGQFDYRARPIDAGTPGGPVLRHDHSCTHYGTLGLWEGAKRGVRVSKDFWTATKNHWIDAQKLNGGWSYSDRASEAPYGSMTAAGTTVLLIAQQELYRHHVLPDPTITKAIEKGIGWLDTHFSGYRNALRDGATGYYLYAIERVALASGLRYLNKEDWFRVGARYFMQAQRDDGSIGGSAVDSCFGLMFLARGHVPVWASKIKLPGTRWNNRPNDMYFLTDFLSNHFEQEVNWQVLDVNAPVKHWLNAPVAYMASDKPVELNPEQMKTLKRYLDLGGLLVASPDNGSSAFTRSIQVLAKKLYPELMMQPVKEDHPIFNLLYVMGDASGQTVYTLNNGSRDLIIMASRDWGFSWQSERRSQAGATNTFKIATNLFGYATDRGRLSNRLVPKYEARSDERRKSGTLKIGVARYKGNWNPEPTSWEQLGNHVFNFTGVEIDTSEVVDLSRVGSSRLTMIRLSGTQPYGLSTVEKSAIRRYLRRGGTLYVETVGGRTGFARKIERQLESVMQGAARIVPDGDPLLTAKGLVGGYELRNVEYRPWAIINLKLARRPRLAAFYEKGRPAVIISDEDLALGALGVRHSGIGGYSPETSKKLMTNILLWAYKQAGK